MQRAARAAGLAAPARQRRWAPPAHLAQLLGRPWLLLPACLLAQLLPWSAAAAAAQRPPGAALTPSSASSARPVLPLLLNHCCCRSALPSPQAEPSMLLWRSRRSSSSSSSSAAPSPAGEHPRCSPLCCRGAAARGCAPQGPELRPL
jgi:hypothetical protein